MAPKPPENSSRPCLQGETVVVTGGAVRLGRAIALECARAGASVVITYNHSTQAAKSTVEELQSAADNPSSAPNPARFAALPVDVCDAAQVDALAQAVQRDFGGATALVNNAAIFRRTPFATLTEQDFDDHIAANLKGPYLLCKRFGDMFLQRGGGSIVNLADIHGRRPLANYVPYCISKAGVLMLTEALALALAPTVRVNCVCPGTILVPSQRQGEGDDEALLIRKIPAQRLGSPEEIAAAVVFLLGGPAFITGAILEVDGAEHLR